MVSAFRRGFTILELIIVIAVFGLLATLAALSLNSARASLRDAQRLSDVSVLRAALSAYYLEKATFPLSGGVDLGQPGTDTDVFTGSGFVAADQAQPPIYLERVPVGPRNNEYYRFRGGATGYSVRFVMETETDLGPPNVYYAHQSGIDREDAER